MSRVLLFEGTCGAGKTSLIERVCDRSPGSVVFSQRMTYGPIAPLEDAGTLDDACNVALLRTVLSKIREIVDASPECDVLVDTLHITQRIRPGMLSAASFAEIDRDLAALGTQVVFLGIDRAEVLRRTVIGRAGTGFRDYARKFGADDAAVADHFFAEQRRMLRLLDTESALPFIALNGNNPTEMIARRVLRLGLRQDRR